MGMDGSGPRGARCCGVRVRAPAKVNLHLEVLAARPDGYHDLVSLFQAVDLEDEVGLERTGRPGPVELSGMAEVAARANLVTRAVELARARAGIDEGIRATIVKRVPLGAGLGGGSSDAAAALRGMQALFPAALSGDVLHACAVELGSDVPFFLAGAAALARGRGEVLRALAPRTGFAVLAVTPSEGVATAAAFSWLDAERRAGATNSARPPVGGGSPSPEQVAEAYLHGEVGRWPFLNSFDPPVRRHVPAVAAALDRLREAGAPSPRLTGSGSTVIAVFARPADATACARLLAVAPPRGTLPAGVRVLAPLASLPGVDYYG